MKSSILLGLGLFGGALSWNVGQTVQTSSGPVTGRAGTVNKGVSCYLGIPYAVPPVNALRWTAPKKFVGTKPIKATEYGRSCVAQLSYYAELAASTPAELAAKANLTAAGYRALSITGQIGDVLSEDCLTINVFTKPQSGVAKKAVMVYIYGGGFNTGNSNSPIYDAQHTVEEDDVVIVTFNYRLNIFGFPGKAGLTQNLGLLDQRLAIEWVRDNIAGFGGDKSRITIFGHSAGAQSTDYYSYAWRKDPIISGIIQQSGDIFLLPQIKADVADGNFHAVATAVGCTPGPTVLNCMRGKPFADIVAAVGANGTLSFNPTIDEKVVFSDYVARSAAGQYIKAPILMGIADYEAGFFRTFTTISGLAFPEEAWVQVNLDAFDCPIAARSNISLTNRVPTWRYRYFGNFPNTRLTTVPDSGAWHGSELSLVWDSYSTGPGIPPSTPKELAIAKYIRGAWTTFAKNPTSGLTYYGWPQYSPYSNSLVRLAYDNKTGPNLSKGNLYDGACPTTFALKTYYKS